jgi:NAD-dependent dihydropyrimidine dehydrogenase PreA subunit
MRSRSGIPSRSASSATSAPSSARTRSSGAKVYEPSELANAPESFKSDYKARFKDFPDSKYTLQVAPEDCTGCELCVSDPAR